MITSEDSDPQLVRAHLDIPAPASPVIIKDVRWESLQQGAVRLQEGAQRLGPKRHGAV